MQDECANRTRDSWLIPFGGGGTHQHDLLLIGGSQLEIEIMEIVVGIRFEQCEISSKNAHDFELVFLGHGVDSQQRRSRPGDIGGMRSALHGIPGRQMIDDVVGLHDRIVNIDWYVALVLSNKGVFGARFEDQAGKNEALAGRSTEASAKV